MSQAAASYVDLSPSQKSMQDWYAKALAETWREPAHEIEAQQAGEIIADLRQK